MAIFEPNIYMREIKELYSEELDPQTDGGVPHAQYSGYHLHQQDGP